MANKKLGVAQIEVVVTNQTPLEVITSEPVSVLSYRLITTDTSSNPQYFGFMDSSGAWYIQKIDGDAGTARYITGTTGFTTAWDDRGSPSTTYLLPNEAFG